MSADILVIEDELLIQKSVCKILTGKGYSCVGTSSGREAIDLISKHQFKKILTDLMLKDLSGFDIIEEYKNNYHNDISKIFVVMTAYQTENVKQQIAKYKCPVFYKPFENIFELVNEVTKGI